MKAIVQRVSKAKVTIDGKINGKIGRGLVVLIAVKEGDNENTMKWMANKLANLRVFPDEEGKMNLSVQDVGGGILFISNFTVYGNVKKGFRPSYSKAAGPDFAEPMYDKMAEYMKQEYDFPVETGIFGAMMDVELVNDGPVTVIIEKEEK